MEPFWTSRCQHHLLFGTNDANETSFITLNDDHAPDEDSQLDGCTAEDSIIDASLDAGIYYIVVGGYGLLVIDVTTNHWISWLSIQFIPLFVAVVRINFIDQPSISKYD